MLDQPPFAQKQMPGMTQQAPPGTEAMPAEDIDSVPEEQASPEQQAIYDRLMPICYEIMADEKAFPMLEKMLASDPLNAIADATVTVLDALEKREGEQDPDILMGLAEEIIPELADLAAGLGTEIPDHELEQVAAVAIAKWSKAHPDRVDQEGMQAIGGAAIKAVQGGEDVQAG